MGTKCDPIRTQLYALEEQLKKTPKFVTGDTAGKGHQQKVSEEWTNLDTHIRRTRMALRECEEP